MDVGGEQDWRWFLQLCVHKERQNVTDSVDKESKLEWEHMTFI